jgi:hypothetical protein
MRKPFIFAGVLALSCALWHPVKADVMNQIPSCYAANDVQPFGPGHDKLVVVLIDQTVLLDQNLKTMVLENLDQMLQPGTRFVVGEFSAFSQGRYLNIVETGVIEPSIPQDQIGNVVATQVQPLQDCLRDQVAYAKRTAEQNAYQIMLDSTSSLAQSDIMMALKQLSAPIKADTATSKVLILVSDGLENSDVTSFYGRGTVRNIDPNKEIAKAVASNMTGDFGGTKVYVIGGGMMPPPTVGAQSQRDGYRDPKTLNDLEQFWSTYFQKSNAQLEEFGEPALLSPVSY